MMQGKETSARWFHKCGMPYHWSSDGYGVLCTDTESMIQSTGEYTPCIERHDIIKTNARVKCPSPFVSNYLLRSSVDARSPQVQHYILSRVLRTPLRKVYRECGGLPQYLRCAVAQPSPLLTFSG